MCFSADQSGDELSEDPGFALLYVCAAVLSGVITQRVCIIFNFFFDTVFPLLSRPRDLYMSLWAGWSPWRFSTALFSLELLAHLSKRPTWKKSSLTHHLLSLPAVRTLELTGQNLFSFHHSKVIQSLCLTVSIPDFFVTANKNSLNLFYNRTYSWKRRNISAIRRLSAHRHSRERRPLLPQERLRYIPDDSGRGGRWQNYQRWHGIGRWWTRTPTTQERSAGDRPLHHLWQPNRLKTNAASWQHCRIQGSAMGHGACLDLTFFCAPDPSSIYLFIDRQNQQRHRAVTTSIRGGFRRFQLVLCVSDEPIRLSHWVRVVVATCSQKSACKNTRWCRLQREDCLCQLMCVCVQKHNQWEVVFRKNKSFYIFFYF